MGNLVLWWLPMMDTLKMSYCFSFPYQHFKLRSSIDELHSSESRESGMCVCACDAPLSPLFSSSTENLGRLYISWPWWCLPDASAALSDRINGSVTGSIGGLQSEKAIRKNVWSAHDRKWLIVTGECTTKTVDAAVKKGSGIQRKHNKP